MKQTAANIAGVVVRWGLCAVIVWAFVWGVAQFYLPGKGFTFFLSLGDRNQAHYLPELRGIAPYIEAKSLGYDAQQYVQLAMRPQLSAPELATAVDTLPYRARRILLSWTAWLVAGGDPVRAVHVFSVQNVVAWLALAGLLLRWLPPANGENIARWSGVLFSVGLIWSVRGALLDGPSLLLIAVGVALAERGQPWWSALVLGFSGLAKETNLLAGVVVLPAAYEGLRDWRSWFGQCVLLVLPLVLWLGCLLVWIGTQGDSGTHNFGLPLAGYLTKWQVVLHHMRSHGFDSYERYNVPVLVALLTQCLFFLLRPRWTEFWWRVGAANAVLMLFLGDAVWEIFPCAAVRVLLPMQLAFNIVVPRGGGRWWALLILGNLSLLSMPSLLKPPAQESHRIVGTQTLRIDAISGRSVEVTYGAGWLASERSLLEYWRWADGSAELTIVNPQSTALAAELRFGLRSPVVRQLQVCAPEKTLWSGEISKTRRDVLFAVVLPPGKTCFRFVTSDPATSPGHGDPRQLTFSMRDLQVVLRERIDRTSP
ncbi:MAG: hypothetical protein HZA31_03110 [Opitutae bacterium]|nr:hypothetical protein [Opitutae bacterium]